MTHEMPFVQHLVESFVLGLADGPTEVHKVTLARLLLGDREPAPDLFPSEHLLPLRQAAEEKFADRLAAFREASRDTSLALASMPAASWSSPPRRGRVSRGACRA